MSLSTFTRSVRIERPAAEVFAWHERPGAFERLAPPWRAVRVVEQGDDIRDGARVTVLAKIGPFTTHWEVEHRDFVEGVQFRDVQVSGPFAHWDHLHRVDPVDGGRACVLTDTITYRLPFGAVGRVLGGAVVRRELERLCARRHAITKADVEGAARYISVRRMTFLVAGASGLLGTALTTFLQTQGHAVIKLVRRETRAPDEVFWNPASGALDPQALRGVDVVVNLSGSPLTEGRWNEDTKEEILASRVESTRTLVAAISAVKSERLRPFALISASGVGAYGHRGDERLHETAKLGRGFLADVCEAWEREAIAAEALGLRVVRLRTGVVLTPAGGALAKLLPLFKAGLGGRLASGRMWMSWISIDDLVGAIYHAVLDRRCDGAVNLVAPNPVTNAEFTRTLAKVLRRPAVLPVPKFALKAAFGEMAEATLLTSTRAVPGKLRDAGYVFRHDTLAKALRATLGRGAGAGE